VLARLSVRQTALGASGVRKKDHIVDPRTRTPARGRLAAWVAVPRTGAQAAEGGKEAEGANGSEGAQAGPRVAAAAVTDALTTAFMLLSLEEIEGLCERSPGLEAWILMDTLSDSSVQSHFLHFGGPRS
jgi:thiamine biosynthesis lipoprotein ApbE